MTNWFPQQTNRAPEFTGTGWLNSEHPLHLADLYGQPVLVLIWDYSCINSLRILPYVREWQRRYAAAGLVIIGVHTPRFRFGREHAQVAWAVERLGLDFPVVLDDEYALWNAYQNRFWPAVYLIDGRGFLRYQRAGASHMMETERAIQTLLREMTPQHELPPPIPDPDRMTRPAATPELRAGLEGGALGNPEGYADRVPVLYNLPNDYDEDTFYLNGAWQAAHQHLIYKGQTEGTIRLHYVANNVYAILSPHAELVERMLHPEPTSVEVWQDALPVMDDDRGEDLNEGGHLLVDRPRLYHLVQNASFGAHELTLRVRRPGFTLYAFTFESTAV